MTMSRDPEIDGYTNRRGHPEASTGPFLSLVLQDDESDDEAGQVRSVASYVAVACTSETDEGDYETSSEGRFSLKLSGTEVHRALKESHCGYSEEKSTSSSKLVAPDSDGSPIKREVILDPQSELVENRLTWRTVGTRSPVPASESLIKSKSLPILKNEVPSDASVNLKVTDVALTSESSFARKKKMSMIVKRMAPLIPPYPSIASVTTDLTGNFSSEQHESKVTLLVPQGATPTLIDDERSEELVARVTLNGTRSSDRVTEQAFRQDATTSPMCVNNETTSNLTNNSDLIDDVRTSNPPIKSDCLLANPLATITDDTVRPEKRPWVSTDASLKALLKLDHELGPLRCKLSEIVGKARALGLNGANVDLNFDSRSDLHLYLSPNVSDGLLNPTRTSRPATTNCSFENRSGLVGKTTSPSSTFSVVDKPAPRESRTSWLNGNAYSSGQQQEALSFALGGSTRTFGSPMWSLGGRFGNSASHLPTGASRRGDALGVSTSENSRDTHALDGDFQLQRKSLATIERDMLAWKVSWSAHSRLHANYSSLLYETEQKSRECLYRSVENSRLASDGTRSELRERKSSGSDGHPDSLQLNPWNTSRTTCRSNYTSKSTVVLDDNGVSLDRNSVATQTRLAIRGDNRHKSTQTETVAEDRPISRPVDLRWIDRCVGPDRQMPRAVSAAVCTSRIRVVSVSKEFHAATVEKRCSSPKASPSRELCAVDTEAVVSSSSSNVLLAVSSVFVQQVRELPEVAGPLAAERNGAPSPERDPRPLKFAGCAPVAKKDPLKLGDSEEVPVIPPKSGKTQRPLVTPDVFSETTTRSARASPRVPNANSATFKCIDELTSQLRQVVPVRTRGGRFSSKGSGEASPPGNVFESCMYECLPEEESVNEKHEEAEDTGEVSVSRVRRNGLCGRRENRSPPMTRVDLRDPRRPIPVRSSRSARLGRKMREYRRPAGAGVIARAIPGMRSSPEDFFCDT